MPGPSGTVCMGIRWLVAIVRALQVATHWSKEPGSGCDSATGGRSAEQGLQADRLGLGQRAV